MFAWRGCQVESNLTKKAQVFLAAAQFYNPETDNPEQKLKDWFTAGGFTATDEDIEWVKQFVTVAKTIPHKANSLLATRGFTFDEANAVINGYLNGHSVQPEAKSEQTEQTEQPRTDVADSESPSHAVATADAPTVDVVPNANTEPSAEPQNAPKTEKPGKSKFEKFILFNQNIDVHRSRPREEIDGWHFIRAVSDSSKDDEILAYHAQQGRYPIGIAERGGSISDAYFPLRTTTNHEERMWVAQAESLKAWAEWYDAFYAEWPDLQEFQGGLKPVPSFNPDWLPQAIRPWVLDVSKRTSVPIDFAAICSICSLAGCTGRRVFVYPKANDKEWREAICIPGAVVASSGKTKTPTWKAFMNPVLEIEHDWEDEFKKRMAQYEEKLAAWEDIQKQNKAETKAAAKAKRQAVLNQTPKPEEPTPRRRVMLNDSTPEKMHDIMKENPQGVFYYRDELSGWAAEMDMTGREAQRDLFLAAMNGDQSHAVDRIGREGGHAMMCATVFGSFQPHLMVNFLSAVRNIADGTLPRFHAIIWPDNLRTPKADIKKDDGAKQQYRHVLRELAKLKPESVRMNFTSEAQQLFYKFQAELDEKIERETDPGKVSHLSKYFGGLPKIAALFQLVDIIVQQGSVHSNVYDIDEEHFQKAWDFLRYLEAHMRRIYDSKLSGVDYCKGLLIDRIKNGDLKEGLTAREIHVKDWGGLGRKSTSADTIDAALEELTELGWVRMTPIKPGTVGRPSKRWEVNPAAKVQQR
jgi:Protein of unknown function (DUF3987)